MNSNSNSNQRAPPNIMFPYEGRLPGMPKSVDEQVAFDYMCESIRDLFYIKLADLGFPDMQGKSFFDLTDGEIKAIELAKNQLRIEIPVKLNELRTEIAKIMASLGKDTEE